MTTYLGKSCSFGLLRVTFVNYRQFMYRPLPPCGLCVSRYYYLCRSDFSFPTFFLCISFHFNSVYVETVNMKQRISRGDFSCPRRIFCYICHCLCRSIKSALAWAPCCLLRLYPNNNKNQLK